MWYILIYVLSLIITGGGAIYLLREELAADRRRIEQNYELEVTWLNIVGGIFLVILPLFNSIIAIAIVGSLLDRPVVTKRKRK